ncbi:MAG: hypothetical protein J5682_05870 [Prevotella sp.]|nr:hypothetical protein [Prevotella sp.]
MKSTGQKKDTDNSLSLKWVYAIIVVLVLGFGTYGYFKVKQWVRYAAIERNEKPISDYVVTKVYSDKDRYKTKHRGVDYDEESDPDYYMEVSYKGKDYKLDISEYTYENYKKKGDVTLYYDSKGDQVFVSGSGGGNLLVTALAAVVLLIIIFILLVRLLIQSIKKKKT